MRVFPHIILIINRALTWFAAAWPKAHRLPKEGTHALHLHRTIDSVVLTLTTLLISSSSLPVEAGRMNASIHKYDMVCFHGGFSTPATFGVGNPIAFD